MTNDTRPGGASRRWFRRRMTQASIIAVLGVVAIAVTNRLIDTDSLGFLNSYRYSLVAIELIVFGVAASEAASSAIRARYADYYDRPSITQRRIAIRAVFRVVT
ncbi:MAG: hypothetical protein FJ318_08510 [SAR202 cluster bacterium]|nr:hypothetical protein [SAR202 cluster bacterium]